VLRWRFQKLGVSCCSLSRGLERRFRLNLRNCWWEAVTKSYHLAVMSNKKTSGSPEIQRRIRDVFAFRYRSKLARLVFAFRSLRDQSFKTLSLDGLSQIRPACSACSRRLRKYCRETDTFSIRWMRAVTAKEELLNAIADRVAIRLLEDLPKTLSGTRSD
jgi:hypothetical protein